jgi:hypothetical protein
MKLDERLPAPTAGHERTRPVPEQPVVRIGAAEVSPGRGLSKSQCRAEERLGQRALRRTGRRAHQQLVHIRSQIGVINLTPITH